MINLLMITLVSLVFFIFLINHFKLNRVTSEEYKVEEDEKK